MMNRIWACLCTQPGAGGQESVGPPLQSLHSRLLPDVLPSAGSSWLGLFHPHMTQQLHERRLSGVFQSSGWKGHSVTQPDSPRHGL